MSDEFWTIEDFGFTAVNENELEIAKQASSASSTASENEEKLKKLHDSNVLNDAEFSAAKAKLLGTA